MDNEDADLLAFLGWMLWRFLLWVLVVGVLICAGELMRRLFCV